MRNLLVVASGRAENAGNRGGGAARGAKDIMGYNLKMLTAIPDCLTLDCNKSTSDNVPKRRGKDLPE
jgi:hypothetical protein